MPINCDDTAIAPYTEDDASTSEACGICGVCLPVCECEGEDTVCIPVESMRELVAS